MVNAGKAIITDATPEESMGDLRLQIVANAKILYSTRLGSDYENFMKANLVPVMMFDVILVTADSTADTPNKGQTQLNLIKALLVYQETTAKPTGRVLAEGPGAVSMAKALESLLSILIYAVGRLKGHAWQPMDPETRLELQGSALNSSFVNQ